MWRWSNTIEWYAPLQGHLRICVSLRGCVARRSRRMIIGDIKLHADKQTFACQSRVVRTHLRKLPSRSESRHMMISGQKNWIWYWMLGSCSVVPSPATKTDAINDIFSLRDKSGRKSYDVKLNKTSSQARWCWTAWEHVGKIDAVYYWRDPRFLYCTSHDQGAEWHSSDKHIIHLN
jgi:hypothetical protein